jgi:DNA-directed RNA polymerase sigma subunit (sigma70/sigma32)
MAEIKLSTQDIIDIRILCVGTNLTDTEIGNIFNVSRKHINAIRHRKRWDYEYC